MDFVGEGEEREEHEEHEGEFAGYNAHTHTQIGLSSLARTTNSIEVAGKDLPVEVPQRDRQIEAREI